MKKRLRVNLKDGFTLVETMIAGSILVSVSLVVTLWFTGVSRLWWTTSIQNEFSMVTQNAVLRMVDELRNSTLTSGTTPPDAVIPAAPNNTSITFYVPVDTDGNGMIIDNEGNTEWNPPGGGPPVPIQFVYDPDDQQLTRSAGGVDTLLANNVSAVTFEDNSIDAALAVDEIRISLTLQMTTPDDRVITTNSVEVVRLRN